MKATFLTDLILSPIRLENSNDSYFRIVEPFVYRSHTKVIVVPENFVTDFASVPRMLWALIPPWGMYGKAAVVHDFLYESHQFSRKISDEIFLEAMEELNVPLWKRRAMYRAVRLFGWVPYSKAPVKRDERRDKLLLSKYS